MREEDFSKDEEVIEGVVQHIKLRVILVVEECGAITVNPPSI